MTRRHPKPLKLGACFAGYGGLDLAVADVLDVDLKWVSEFDTAPSYVLGQRFPDAPNFGDITAIKWVPDCPNGHDSVFVDGWREQYVCDDCTWTLPLSERPDDIPEPVDVWTGGSPCFPAGTLIDTYCGYTPIEDIQIGDLVRTHTGRYMPVNQVMSRIADDTITVQAMGAPPFVTTVEHPFWVRVKGQVWNNSRRQYERVWSDPEWVPASELTNSHFIGYQLDTPDGSAIPLGTDLAYMIGRWLGDGWVRNGKRTSHIEQGHRGSRIHSRWWQMFICCAHDEADELEQKIRAAGYTPTRFVERTVTKFRVCSEALVRMLLEFGSGAANKHIPGWVYRLPLAEQQAIWQGWVDADGSVNAAGKVRATTTSEQLAHAMARIARNVFRRAVSVHKFAVPPTTVIEGRTVNQKPQYQVVLPVDNREAFIDGDWCWAPVRTVEDAPKNMRVFNFGVAEDESYTAWGITVHNCQDLSHAGKRLGMKEGTRSGLWASMLDGIKKQKPQLVIWENVGGAFSAEATSSMEPCPGCVGDGSEQPILRALGRVLGDLTETGYDAQWHSLRAADVGAPHGRLRVFVVAWPRAAGKPRLVGRSITTNPVRSGDGWRAVAPGYGEGTGSDVAAQWSDSRVDGEPRSAVVADSGGNTVGVHTRSSFGAETWTQKGDFVEHSGGTQSAVMLLPTPAVNDMGAGKTVEHWDEWAARQKSADGRPAPHGKSLHIEAIRLLGTPRAADGMAHDLREGAAIGDARGRLEDQIALLPTPRTANNENRQSPGYGPNLGEALNSLLPTPGARDWKDSHVQAAAHRPDDKDNLSRALAHLGLGEGVGEPVLLATPQARDSKGLPGEGFNKSNLVRDVHSLFPTPRATDGTKGGPNQRGSSGDLMLPSAVHQLLPTPKAGDGEWGLPRTSGRPPERSTHLATRIAYDTPVGSDAFARTPHDTTGDGAGWGDYGPAVRRWELTIGRPAPSPVEPNQKTGAPQLSPFFVEWMMGLQEGWVTDFLTENKFQWRERLAARRAGQDPRPVGLRGSVAQKPSNLSHAHIIKMLGNGVVPRQAAAAIRTVLTTD